MVTRIKKAMLDNGREDFTKYLSQLLGCTVQTANNKFKGVTSFTADELEILMNELHIPPDELFRKDV